MVQILNWAKPNIKSGPDLNIGPGLVVALNRHTIAIFAVHYSGEGVLGKHEIA